MDGVSEELERFREQWRAEVRQRTTRSQNSASATTQAQDAAFDSLPPLTDVQNTSILSGKHPHSADYPVASSSSASLRQSVPPVPSTSAVQTYRLAIQYEQAGQLDDALRYYRNAFRTDPNVDKAFLGEEHRLEALGAQSRALKENAKPTSFNSKKDAPSAIVVAKTKQRVQKREDPGALARLVLSFPADLGFEPSDESCPTPFRLLPYEVIILILKTLDPFSLERLFALINRKGRVLSLDSSIWRDLVHGTYVPPQIPDSLDIDSLAEQYMFDYRRVYVEHPRLRLDGVYIAICHYVRAGLHADNVWVRVNHLITYHRYLRFFPDGTVLSLLANEDVEPQIVIPLFKPALRMKGLYVGTWCLEGTTILIHDLVDPGGGNTRYTFRMTLNLRSKPLGRWNRLDITGYDSVNKENGEAIPLGLKHEGPFWFSKVKSYVV